MTFPISITLAELLSIVERLHPDSLLLKRGESGLDEETLERLWKKMAFSSDPQRRLATVEYLLLTMHKASEQDPSGYMTRVFLPWAGIQRRIKSQVMRIVDDIARTEDFEAYSDEDVAHTATKIYRPLVSDVFDPYMTLLTATYAFMDGTFVDIETSNLGALERNKAEVVASRIRQSGGPLNLLDGYDPIVRNALAHAGSDGVLYEPGSILFRNIKRGTPPVVEARRWRHDELHSHVVALMELIMSIDAAVEIFGIDSADTISDRAVSDQFVQLVLDRDQRRAMAAKLGEPLKRLQTMDTMPLTDRLDALGKILFLQCAERDIPCKSVGFNHDHKTCFITVPLDSKPVSDDEVREQVLPLIRYLILGRSVFGTLFDRFVVEGEAAGVSALKVSLPAAPLDEYIEEKAGLVDLVGDAEVWLDGNIIRFELDLAAISAMEDAKLGPRLPRRSRQISN